ncbi:MAG: type II toxin-antitoxin system RelE/ParE family toxin [Rhizomicrobium sp.]
MIVVLSDAAEADLEAIGDWIARDAPFRAVSYVRELRQACDQLGDMPRAFPVLPRYRRSGIRKRVHGNHLIFYTVGEHVEVLHVLHGARDYEAILFAPK